MAELTDLVDQIDACLDRLLALDLSEEPEHVVADGLVAAMGLDTKLDAALARLAGQVDRSGVWREDGSRSASAWLGRRSGRRRSECSHTVRRGQRLGALSLVAEAFATGEISAWHVDLIGRLAQRWPDETAAAEADLVEWARTLDCDGFSQVVAYWTQHIDPDGVEDEAAARHRRRRLDMSDGIDGIDGCGLLDVEFEPLGWATFREALRRIEHELWKHDWAEARARLGERARATDLVRTDSQRRYDALIEMAARAAAAAPGCRRPRPLVTVHVDHDTLAGRICQLSTGVVLTPGQVLPLLAECDIERAVFDSAGRVIDLGRRRRLFAGGARRAVEIEQPTCAHPSCDVPSESCEIDHRLAWDDGGATTPDNGQPLCPPHHRRKSDRRGQQDRSSGDDADGSGHSDAA